MESTAELVARVEKSDDLWPSHVEHYVENVTKRVLPNIFYKHLQHWPTVTVKQNFAASKGGKLVYDITVKHEYYTEKEQLDLTQYKTDKHAYYAILEKFSEEVSKRLITESASGNAWWSDEDKHLRSFFYQYRAKVKFGDKLYSFHTTLAEIKFRGGKWCYYIKPADHRTDWPITEYREGRANSLEIAKATVEAVWKEKPITPKAESKIKTVSYVKGKCINCDNDQIIPETGMCGPCTFGEADALND